MVVNPTAMTLSSDEQYLAIAIRVSPSLIALSDTATRFSFLLTDSTPNSNDTKYPLFFLLMFVK